MKNLEAYDLQIKHVNVFYVQIVNVGKKLFQMKRDRTILRTAPEAKFTSEKVTIIHVHLNLFISADVTDYCCLVVLRNGFII